MPLDSIVKVFAPAVVAFFVGILLTPALSSFLYKNKMWKKKAGKVDLDGKETPIVMTEKFCS